MKGALCALALVICVALPAASAPPAGKGFWLRRITLVAACAASFWDAQSTRVAARHGAVERNRFFADADGNVRWGRMMGVKVGLCAGTAVIQELNLLGRKHPVFMNYAWSAGNSAMASRFVAVALENRRVAARLRSSPPAYLMAEQ